MSLSATLFGTNSLIFKATNILGLGIPGLLHKTFGPQDPEAQVNAIGDISRQTAKEGDPRTIVWGRVRPIGGNIIHCQAPVKRWVVTSTSTGGKGGGKKKQEQRTEHVYRTYAIGVCEGPITGFSRIWRNNKLVYDARGTDWGNRNNGVFLRSFRLYLGGWSQMPDPTLQSIWGAGNVPAYRGTAYMVSIDEDLTDQGGMVPQWQFEVERAEGFYYTSRPYQVFERNSLDAEPANDETLVKDVLIFGDSTEYLGMLPYIESIDLVGPQEFYEHISVEPAVDDINLQGPTRVVEYLEATPSIDKVMYSVTYQRPSPPISPCDGLGMVPGIDEVTLE